MTFVFKVGFMRDIWSRDLDVSFLVVFFVFWRWAFGYVFVVRASLFRSTVLL